MPPIAKQMFHYLFSQTEFGLLCPVNLTDSGSELVARYGSEALRTALLPRFWSPMVLGCLALLYWLTACLGVTIGYHRLLSHRALRVPRWLERAFATCGALSCQHGPIDWVGLHRHHHLHSDGPADHHNSHLGFWWSHVGWFLTRSGTPTRRRRTRPGRRPS